jgi:hypothetical protein
MDAFNSWLTSALETSDLQWLKDTDAADVLGKRWVMEIDIYWLNNKIQINPILKNSSAIKIYVSEVEWRLKEPHIGGYVSAKNRTWGSSLQSMQELCLGLYLTASALPLCQTLLLDSFDQFCLLTLCCSAREVLVIPPPPAKIPDRSQSEFWYKSQQGLYSIQVSSGPALSTPGFGVCGGGGGGSPKYQSW